MQPLLTTARFTHILAALFNLLFIYTPVHQWQYGFAVVQFVSTPLLVLSGMVMVRARKRAALATAPAQP